MVFSVSEKGVRSIGRGRGRGTEFGEEFPDVSEVPDWKDFPLPELDGLTRK